MPLLSLCGAFCMVTVEARMPQREEGYFSDKDLDIRNNLYAIHCRIDSLVKAVMIVDKRLMQIENKLGK